MTKRAINQWIWFVVIATITSSLLIPSWRNVLGRVGVSVVRPIGHAGQWLADTLHFVPSNKTIRAERDALQRQVNDVTARLFEANQQLETAQAITALNEFHSTSHQELRLANIIAISPDPGIQSVVIDQGSDDHIQLGQVVVTDHGYVVGKVEAVHQHNSSVLLLTDRQSKIAARVQNDRQSPGIIRGERGLSLQMEFIPKNDSIKAGQTVVTNGSESNIPPNLFIGTVTGVASKSGELFQQATITPSAALERLRVVAIILPAK